MVLTISTNTSALNVQRNLNEANEAQASSLAKLSSGSRVPTAKDDAASLAIGSRIEAEIAGLNQAATNASQASSLLQIADGAYGEIADILVRQSTLAIQSSSGQISDSERAILDAEFQQLTAETDRIAQDVEFNGNQLINGQSLGTYGATTSNADVTITTPGAGNVGEYTAVIDLTGGANSTGRVELFDASGISLGSFESTGTGDNFGSDAITQTIGGVEINIAATIAANDTVTLTSAEDRSTSTAFSFKVGTGTDAQDSINLTVNAANAASLGTDSLDITNVANANTAIDSIKTASDTLLNARALTGASLSRLDFASSNLSVAIENQSAAKSGLLDVDLAAETTNYAAQQVIVQAGVSLLAQANQQPSQLTKLIG